MRQAIIAATSILFITMMLMGFTGATAPVSAQGDSEIPERMVQKFKAMVKTGAITAEEAVSEMKLLSDIRREELEASGDSRGTKPQMVYHSFVTDFTVKGHSRYGENVYKHNLGSYPMIAAIAEVDGRWYYEPARLGISIRADHESIEVDNPNSSQLKLHMFLYKLTY